MVSTAVYRLSTRVHIVSTAVYRLSTSRRISNPTLLSLPAGPLPLVCPAVLGGIFRGDILTLVPCSQTVLWRDKPPVSHRMYDALRRAIIVPVEDVYVFGAEVIDGSPVITHGRALQERHPYRHNGPYRLFCVPGNAWPFRIINRPVIDAIPIVGRHRLPPL